MPKLLLFAACEKAILDEVGLVSLINIIEKVEFAIPANLELSVHTAFPMRWQSVAIWGLEESEVGKFEQMTQLIAEDGEVVAHTEPLALLSRIAGRTGVKNISTNEVFPVTDGHLLLKVFHRAIGSGGWVESGQWPISITLIRK